MTSPSDRLAQLGLVLPPVATPLAAYVPAVRVGDLVHTSGQPPSVAGELMAVGKVGDEVTAERAARIWLTPLGQETLEGTARRTNKREWSSATWQPSGC